MATGDGPRVLLNASAVGYYGDREQPVDETAPAGSGFLAGVVEAWEAATAPAEQAGVRVARMRTGIVLSADGGALAKMLPIFKLGLGGRFGNGRQWMSWISIEDEVAAIEHLLTSDVHGAVNLTAPNPCRNADFAKTLASVLGRPSIVPVPAFGPKLLLGSERARGVVVRRSAGAAKRAAVGRLRLPSRRAGTGAARRTRPLTSPRCYSAWGGRSAGRARA